MRERPQNQVVGRILANHAVEVVPDDLDLWPAIAKQMEERQFHQDENHTERRCRPAWRVRKMALISGVALTLAALLITAGLPFGDQQGASASAAEALNNLARVAAAQPLDPNLNLSGTENRYRYIKSEELNLAQFAGKNDLTTSALIPKTRELWIAPDGSGRIRETAGSPIFLSEHDRTNWEADPPQFLAMNQDFGPGGLFYEDFTRYPTDPKALADVIRERAEAADPPVDLEMFVVVGDLLRMPGVPPELRSALYKVAAKIKDVELVGSVTDRAGRTGIGVSITTDYWKAKERLTLIFDPATSALLGEEEVLLEKASWLNAKPPVVIGSRAYLESGIVTKLP